MSGALDRLAVMPELLSHEGPFGVGYAVASFIVTGRDESRNFGEQYLAAEDEKTRNIREEESAVVKLARYTVERYVKTGEMPPRPEKIPAELLSRRAGTFVSLHEFDTLRGCIGTFMALGSIVKVMIGSIGLLITFKILGIAIAVVVVLGTFVLRKPEVKKADASDGGKVRNLAVSEMLKTATFWIFMVSAYRSPPSICFRVSDICH